MHIATATMRVGWWYKCSISPCCYPLSRRLIYDRIHHSYLPSDSLSWTDLVCERPRALAPQRLAILSLIRASASAFGSLWSAFDRQVDMVRGFWPSFLRARFLGRLTGRRDRALSMTVYKGGDTGASCRLETCRASVSVWDLSSL